MKLWEVVSGIVVFALSFHGMQYVLKIFEIDNRRKRDKDAPRRMW